MVKHVAKSTLRESKKGQIYPFGFLGLRMMVKLRFAVNCLNYEISKSIRYIRKKADYLILIDFVTLTLADLQPWHITIRPTLRTTHPLEDKAHDDL